MKEPKIQLSPTELNLVLDPGFILTKNSIIRKTIALLENVQQDMVSAKTYAVNDIFSVPPKISKGENYLGLPYVVLDYPRMTQGKNICFIRTMFWWGNFFSSTLQLSGRYKEQHIHKIIASLPLLSGNNYFIGVSDDPWHHHFDESNYRKMASLSGKELESILEKQEHIKIAARYALEEWELAPSALYKSWNFLAGLIT